ncbi:TetR/AcrR family transcriptional regulator [Antrihabitans sp. YC3-6]|uniref:TetR/AcrR family transcriptional regulator n=1 Tax=Antrihabitans stalagmiti TaxID=2799499 RepID=A0A934NM38_9NOCA|nr:TetR/AcrR family transcriptional regulator [Antrihabitans stalagmiti]MBJ8337729.1 TetR/AcrR family transcriptional regulator [Antrihabitans stalagmiti]
MPSAPAEPRTVVPLTGQDARWEKHNTDRENRILQAAVELIELSDAGADVTIAQIAERAGLAKSVLYRRFTGRDELDRRIRSFIAAQLSAAFDSELDYTQGTIRQIISRTILVLVDWVSDHPKLVEFMRTGPSADDDDLDAVSSLAKSVARRANEIMSALATSIGMADNDFQPLTSALVTMTDGSVRQWIRDPDVTMSRGSMVDTLTSYVWFVVDGEIRARGLTVDPDMQVLAVISALLGPQPPS